ncbi:acryloyl-CoA reductase [Ammoniphilus sp. 3BR4]|uniref:NADPH:quinone oxidoreductase family protein n=1 Tax=Ammoniphilus sp. 3BR4 TaxID=3158265 RepID=UPI0034652EF5
MTKRFLAFVVNKTDDQFKSEVKELTEHDLPDGDVTIRVAYSSVNFKDGLASIPNGNIVNRYPFIPGIDLAGTVVGSQDTRFREGDEVLVTGYGLGVSHFGGFSQYARVPADWVVPIPKGLTMEEAMAYGTAGFTAALSFYQLEERGLTPDKGSVLVTGATGGVGSLAVSMLKKKGYEVVASTGKEMEYPYLYQIGAKEILKREELQPEKFPPLGNQRWAGAIDPVGGKSLAYVLSCIKYGGSVAVSGLTGGNSVPTTVLPFILRGVNLLGIDSVLCPMDLRLKLWDKMAGELKPDHLATDIGCQVTLTQLPEVLSEILQGRMRGRAVVNLQ